ncbi:hypothetical protein P7C70_g5156, partial [Phenoliferia sp. Uapishka_3]
MLLPSSPTAPDSLPFPFELLTHILHLSVVHLNDNARSHQLSTYALISHQFRSAAYDVLYRDLHVSWTASTALLLLRSLRANPNLGRATRAFSATKISAERWQKDWIKRSLQSKEAEGTAAVVADVGERADVGDAEDDGLSEEDDNAYFEHEGPQIHFASTLEVSAMLAWDRAGNQRWPTEAYYDDRDVEELLETMELIPALQKLSLVSFSNQPTRKPILDLRFSAAKAIISNLSALTLVKNNGFLGGQFAEHVSQPFVLSSTGEFIWVDGDLTVMASPTSLALIGQCGQRQLIPFMINPQCLHTLSFDLQLFQRPSLRILQQFPSLTVDLFVEWMAFLPKFPNLQTLKIQLAEVDRQLEFDTIQKDLPSRHAPSVSNQTLFGAYLTTSALQHLSIEWWPTRTLFSLLPSSLISFVLGPQYPYDDDPPPAVDLDKVERSDLAGALRHLPDLRVVALPFCNCELEGSSSIRNRTIGELEEFGGRKLELEAAGFIVREAHTP